MIVGEDAFVMLLVEPFFKTFTKRQLCDTRTHTEGLVAISAGSRAEVDRLVKTAVAAGGAYAVDPQEQRLHVRLELLRSRRPPLGGVLDGCCRRRRVWRPPE
jgi:predicted lactoylglutathione lyase